MCLDRREFLKMSAVATGAALAGSKELYAREKKPLKSMVQDIKPISDEERKGRIEKAQRLMRDAKIDAIVLEPGTSLFYFTGVKWWASERPFVLVIPAKGELAWVCPAFEEARARELIRFGKEVRVWQEDESPFERITQVLKDRGISSGRIGIEERLRFFVFDGLKQAGQSYDFVSATPVTAGCRMFKSPAEIALLKRSNEIALVAFKHLAGELNEGMSPHDVVNRSREIFGELGVEGDVGVVGFGKYSAFPHGSIASQTLKEGDVVLMDGGGSLEGYQSDITRTFVFGKPTQRQRQMWNLERRAQDAAFAAVKIGATCESVDAAARKVLTDAGFGPDYKLPGLPHRTGHGIGLDGHEWTNFVRGNKALIAPGMCFSDEPTISIPGEFGIRLEDCLYVTEEGPKFFTPQSPSIDHPF